MKYLMRGKIQKTIAVTMTAFLLLSDTETVTATKTDKNYVEINSEPNFSANKLLSKIKKKSEKKSPVQKQSDKAVIIVEIDGETEDIEGPVDTQDAKSRHSSVFNNINESIANNDELNTEESHVTYLKDYYNIFDGIAVEAYESDVSAIIETEGVKSAYLEKIYSITADEKDDGTEIDDLISLSGIDESDYTGKGQAIAIIDSSLFTGHEVFNTEPEDARYSEDDMEEIRDELGEGCEGSYISAKIPFAYDYADHDNDVNPDNCSSVSARGTHIAGLAVGNADDYRGIAPDAQLIFCKVSPDKKNTVAESDLFSAMDDCLKIGVDEVNLSFSSVTPGFSTTESSALWKDILEKYQEKGIIVNAAAGKNNSDSKENPGSLPDNGNIGRPAAFEKTMAVAGVRLEGMSRSENSFDSAATVGPTPELKLKPDITAPSGIVSASAESSEHTSASSISMP